MAGTLRSSGTLAKMRVYRQVVPDRVLPALVVRLVEWEAVSVNLIIVKLYKRNVLYPVKVLVS